MVEKPDRSWLFEASKLQFLKWIAKDCATIGGTMLTCMEFQYPFKLIPHA